MQPQWLERQAAPVVTQLQEQGADSEALPLQGADRHIPYRLGAVDRAGSACTHSSREVQGGSGATEVGRLVGQQIAKYISYRRGEGEKRTENLDGMCN